ncbi:Uncharacterised protein [Salmonella enterica subsp. enterica serovar Bovismorbificans]|uniref:Uncharacterized protein n=1 Tax=Salmonella enterica subsp. enterica serovar Bovismorbificans TaxID=58097 RepID=A0A655BKP6_SALET|nr:Uncharacterised protein [Salmonella enterica subsp. enterica serovar Bovismorbificans]
MQQRNTVLRGDRDQLHLQIGLVKFLFYRFHNGVGVVLGIADHFLLVVVIRKGHRRFAMPDDDHAIFSDLVQGATSGRRAIFCVRKARRQSHDQHCCG